MPMGRFPGCQVIAGASLPPASCLRFRPEWTLCRTSYLATVAGPRASPAASGASGQRGHGATGRPQGRRLWLRM